MTREGQESRPEDTLAPPASTRWSEETPAEDEGLVAPFIPGQKRVARAQEPARPEADAPEAGSEPIAEPEAESVSAPEPFEPYPEYEQDEPAGAVEPTGTAEPEPADVAEDPFPFDMPWSTEPESAGAGPESETADDAFGGGPWQPGPGESGTDAAAGEAYHEYEDHASEPVGEDDFPMEVFDIEPSTATPALPGSEDDVGGPESPAAEEVAGKLEFLASRLRADGVDGIERELASSDRLTSLLAALLAGHLSGRS